MGKLLRLTIALAFLAGTSGCAFLARVSLDENGNTPAVESVSLVTTGLSTDGRYVLFQTAAPLVAADTNNIDDVYRRDTRTGTLDLVSVSVDGGSGNELSGYSKMSPNGRYVTFYSNSSNLVATDTSQTNHAFVRDLQTGVTTLVSVQNDGIERQDFGAVSIAVSDNGRFALFTSEAIEADGGGWRLYLRDLQAGTTERVDVANDGTPSPPNPSFFFGVSMSADGRFVAFQSEVDNLVPSDTNGLRDVFLRDRQLGTTTRISVGPSGTGWTDGVSLTYVTPDARYIVIGTDGDNAELGDTNGVWDWTLRDRQTGSNTVIGLTADGSHPDYPGGLALSDDARFVLAGTQATNMLGGAPTPRTGHVFLTDRVTGSVRFVSTGIIPGTPSEDYENGVQISGDGRYVAFDTEVSLVDIDPSSTHDIYLRSTFNPSVSSAAPSSWAPGTTATLEVVGEYLLNGGVATLGEGVTVTGAAVTDEHHATLSISIAADAAAGPRTLWLTNPGTGPGLLTGGVAVLPGAITVT